MQQITINDPSGIEIQILSRATKKIYYKKQSFMVIHTTPPSDNPLHFQGNLFQEQERMILIIDDKIKDFKNCIMKLTGQLQRYLHYHQERYKYEFLTGEATQKAIFFSPFRKALKKQEKTIEEQGEKHGKAFEE